MMTPHINAQFGSIAPLVLITGDSLRTKTMSEMLLTNPQLVSTVRNNFIYTGYYQGVKVSIATSGIGHSSMGIYAQELFQFYNVQVLIRVGSCGSFSHDLELMDVINVDGAYSDVLFYQHFYADHWVHPSSTLQNQIKATIKRKEFANIKTAQVYTQTDFYMLNPTVDWARYQSQKWQVLDMEAYTLFVLAKLFHRHAGCLLTVSDLLRYDRQHKNFVVSKKLTPQSRQSGLRKMFLLGLETLITYQKDQAQKQKK